MVFAVQYIDCLISASNTQSWEKVLHIHCSKSIVAEPPVTMMVSQPKSMEGLAKHFQCREGLNTQPNLQDSDLKVVL